MPFFTYNDVTIHYTVHGQGFPVLTFAPGGLQSCIALWKGPTSPIDPASEWEDEFRVICMDQRNAPEGQSRAPITARDGWHSYTQDHVMLLDHLGIDRCHLYGQCIGGPFIMGLLKAVPQRVVCAVIAQPTGRLGPLPPGWNPRFTAWASQVRKFHPHLTDEALDGFYQNMYGPGFVYSVDREFVKTVRTPTLLMAGNDDAHPLALSEELAEKLPGCEFIREWKTGDALIAARARVRTFLHANTPA